MVSTVLQGRRRNTARASSLAAVLLPKVPPDFALLYDEGRRNYGVAGCQAVTRIVLRQSKRVVQLVDQPRVVVWGSRTLSCSWKPIASPARRHVHLRLETGPLASCYSASDRWLNVVLGSLVGCTVTALEGFLSGLELGSETGCEPRLVVGEDFHTASGYVSPLSGISGLSFDSTLLSPLLFFCLVLLPFLSYRFLPAGPFFKKFSRKFFNIFLEEIGFFCMAPV